MPKSFQRPPIPRAKLFGNPDRAMVRLSPDGGFLSWLAPVDGIMNIWVAPRQALGRAKPVTADTKRGIRFYGWSLDARSLLYVQDKDGDENWHVYATDASAGTTRDLTPYPGVHATWMGQSWNRPGTLAIGMNDRDDAWHDLYLVDIATAARSLAFENTGQYGGMTLDRDLGLRILEKPEPDGGRTIYRLDGSKPEAWLRIPHGDNLTTGLEGFTADGKTLYLSSSLGRDKAALYAVDWATGQQRLMAEHDKVDIGRLMTHPVTYEAEAYGTHYLTGDWHALTPAMADEFERLKRDYDPEFDVVSRTRANDLWVLTGVRPERPGQYHLYDRKSGRTEFLFESRPELAGETLSRMQPVVIPSRDRLELVSYLTLPASIEGDRSAKPLPMVLDVHGGPWAAMTGAYDPEHQWLANRGYAVLSVNYRGSTGFGKDFINAANGEWAGKMHDDLLDAVELGRQAEDRRPGQGRHHGRQLRRLCHARRPDLHAGRVRLRRRYRRPVEPRDAARHCPALLGRLHRDARARVGDPRTEAGRALLRDRSPLHRAGNISRPLLIGQGANDPRVKQAESDQIVTAMRDKNIPVTYVLYPDEGHGFAGRRTASRSMRWRRRSFPSTSGVAPRPSGVTSMGLVSRCRRVQTASLDWRWPCQEQRPVMGPKPKKPLAFLPASLDCRPQRSQDRSEGGVIRRVRM